MTGTDFRGLIVTGLPPAPPPPQTVEEMYELIRSVWDSFEPPERLKVVMSPVAFAGALDVAPNVLHPGSPRTIIYGCPIEIDDTADVPRLETL